VLDDALILAGELQARELLVLRDRPVVSGLNLRKAAGERPFQIGGVGAPVEIGWFGFDKKVEKVHGAPPLARVDNARRRYGFARSPQKPSRSARSRLGPSHRRGRRSAPRAGLCQETGIQRGRLLRGLSVGSVHRPRAPPAVFIAVQPLPDYLMEILERLPCEPRTPAREGSGNAAPP
jgi:hypothetical protein